LDPTLKNDVYGKLEETMRELDSLKSINDEAAAAEKLAVLDQQQ
jgi:hypothetical protein